MVDYILLIVIVALLAVIAWGSWFYMSQIDKLTSKLIARDLTDYTRTVAKPDKPKEDKPKPRKPIDPVMGHDY